MATNRVLGDYGAPYVNKGAIEDPTAEADADKYNRMAEDVAQMSRTSPRVILHFPTVASGNSTPSYTETQWGSGASYYPTTVTRSGVGAYTITYPTSFNDGLGEAETVAFQTAVGSVQSSTVFGAVQVTASANVLTVRVLDGTFSVVDLTAGTTIRVEAR